MLTVDNIDCCRLTQLSCRTAFFLDSLGGEVGEITIGDVTGDSCVKAYLSHA